MYTITTIKGSFCHKMYLIFSLIEMTHNSKKNKCYYQLWNEPLKKLRDEQAPGVSDRECLCCQSKAEQ